MNAQNVVYLVDDDAGVTRSLSSILTAMDYSVETFSTADEFLNRSAEAAPGCLVVDLLLPGTTGLELCKIVTSRKLPLAFLVITGHGDIASAVEAMRLGAIDFLEKPFSHQKLVAGIKLAVENARLRFESAGRISDVYRRLSSLTSGERKVLDLLALGLLTKEIARRLRISTRTVDVHRSRIMGKLHIESPLQLGHFFYLVESCENRFAATKIA